MTLIVCIVILALALRAVRAHESQAEVLIGKYSAVAMGSRKALENAFAKSHVHLVMSIA